MAGAYENDEIALPGYKGCWPAEQLRSRTPCQRLILLVRASTGYPGAFLGYNPLPPNACRNGLGLWRS
jgi:hypothetical protein